MEVIGHADFRVAIHVRDLWTGDLWKLVQTCLLTNVFISVDLLTAFSLMISLFLI